ncbi:hypothetical protein P152DRAFT_167170 [Eremomyces bilateralis CBS 781.70]|uniref:Uncharacterized protein n=1 Tax=Eremomyces bilateralis CBS 781.70 TaxID=1392243 RepID=A0A6G1FU10_9PEZI|nr:uncharacterized protein P152DRAFT_167170 [Eremomyces bilateralis CBS 781.70]KAF1809243.1 hypothetical protein P152DRAFT_167170 [Eremomyces bilateralis CBS 781.70]
MSQDTYRDFGSPRQADTMETYKLLGKANGKRLAVAKPFSSFGRPPRDFRACMASSWRRETCDPTAQGPMGDELTRHRRGERLGLNHPPDTKLIELFSTDATQGWRFSVATSTALLRCLGSICLGYWGPRRRWRVRAPVMEAGGDGGLDVFLGAPENPRVQTPECAGMLIAGEEERLWR